MNERGDDVFCEHRTLNTDHNFGSKTPQQCMAFCCSQCDYFTLIKMCSWSMERQAANENECSLHSIDCVVCIYRFRRTHAIFKSYKFFTRKRKKCPNFIHISHGICQCDIFFCHFIRLFEFIELCSQPFVSAEQRREIIIIKYHGL